MSGIYASMQHVWTLPLTEVLLYSVLNAVMRLEYATKASFSGFSVGVQQNNVQFYPGLSQMKVVFFYEVFNA